MKLSQLLKRLTISKDPTVQRELILDAWQNCEHFFVGLQLSCDPTNNVIVKKIPEIDVDDGYEGTLTFQQFIDLFDKATQIDADPEEIRNLIIEATMEANYAEWNFFYRKILLKKLQNDLPMDIIVSLLSELTGSEKPL